jgi:glutamate synthase domain-containing protein 1
MARACFAVAGRVFSQVDGVCAAKEGEYAVGMFFLPLEAEICRSAVRGLKPSQKRRFSLLGWRTVPTNLHACGLWRMGECAQRKTAVFNLERKRSATGCRFSC